MTDQRPGIFYERAEGGMLYTGPGDHVQYYQWALGSDSGISSKTIVQALTGAEVLGSWHPSPPFDVADFGRCVRLLDLFPWLREGLFRLPQLHSSWPQALSDEWAQLEALYREELAENTGEAPRLYARLREIVNLKRVQP